MEKILVVKNGLHAFFISNTFISHVRLKLAKNQEKAKQNHEAEHLLLENYLLSSSKLSLFNWGYMINYNENEAKKKNRQHRYDINRPA